MWNRMPLISPTEKWGRTPFWRTRRRELGGAAGGPAGGTVQGQYRVHRRCSHCRGLPPSLGDLQHGKQNSLFDLLIFHRLGTNTYCHAASKEISGLLSGSDLFCPVEIHRQRRVWYVIWGLRIPISRVRHRNPCARIPNGTRT